MKTLGKRLRLYAPLALTAGAMLLGGCEGGDDPGSSSLDSYFANNPYVSDPRGRTENPVSVSPDSTFISVAGEQIAFRATGGSEPYTWDSAIPANGTVSASANRRTGVYTSAKLAANNVIVYDRNGYAAIAQIDVTTPGAALSASASPDTLSADGGRSALSASGGVPPYNWSVSDVALGNIDASSGTSVLYTRYNAGDNGVRVTDQNGDTITLVIRQP